MDWDYSQFQALAGTDRECPVAITLQELEKEYDLLERLNAQNENKATISFMTDEKDLYTGSLLSVRETDNFVIQTILQGRFQNQGQPAFVISDKDGVVLKQQSGIPIFHDIADAEYYIMGLETALQYRRQQDAEYELG